MKLFSLSQAQIRIWYSQKKYKQSPLYNIGGTLEIIGTANLVLLRRAIEDVYWSNEALRFRFYEKDNEVKQYISSKELFVDIVDFSVMENPEQSFREWCNQQAVRPFLMTEESLCYFAVYKVREDRTGYFIKIHHILADGWSIKLFTDQVKATYEQLVHGKKVEKVSKPSYLEYVRQEEKYLISEECERAGEYWKGRTVFQENSWHGIGGENTQGKRKTFFINNDMQIKLEEYLKEKHISVHMFFICISLIYEYKKSGREDIIFGIPLLGRSGRVERQTFGTFTNTMPYQYNISQNETVYVMIKRISMDMHHSFRYQKYPYNLLHKAVDQTQKTGEGLYHMCVNYYNTVLSTEIDGLPVINNEFYNGCQDYSLQIIIRHWNESKLQLDFDYQSKEYTDQQIEEMFHIFLVLINQVLENDGIFIKDLLLIDYKERDRLLFECNRTKNEYPHTKSVIDLFCGTSKKYPKRVAVSKGQEYICYKQLNMLSDKAAQSLWEHGIRQGNTVVIIPEYTIASVAVILGIMKCGAVYVPLDTKVPKERVEMIAEGVKASLILGNKKLSANVRVFGIEDMLNSTSVGVKLNCSNAQKIAYILYTSGSTGMPKGVMVTHRNLVNYLCWAAKTYVKNEKEVFSLFSSFAFDFTVTSLFLPLVTGSEIRLYDCKEHINVLEYILEEGRTTILKVTPSQASLMKGTISKSASLHTIIFGGEELRADICKELMYQYDGNIDIYNEYGPTETTVGCTIYRYREEDEGFSVPIGQPIDNVQVYVLDKDKNPQPINMVGEIYVGGDGVAAGYYDIEDETKKSFIEDTIQRSGTLYKTGDLAFRDCNNNLIYCGRIDRQVKIRGYRVELEEIEKRILYSGLVKQVFVKSINFHEKHSLLCAYIVGMEGKDEPRLKKYLAEILPDYMIPTFFIRLEQFPITENGKLDTSNLPYPVNIYKEKKSFTGKEYSILVEAVKAVLPESTISPDKNFYEMGGDSIKAILVSSYLYEKGYNLSSGDILSHPGLFQMIEYMRKRPIGICNQGIVNGFIEKTNVVSWFLNRRFVQAEQYNQSILLEWKQSMPISFLKQVMQQLIKHHDGLRMNLDRTRNKLFYNNKHLIEKEILTVIEVSGEEISLEEVINENTNSKFDIYNELLFRPYLILAEKKKYIYIIMHHLISDGISMRILLEDLTRLLLQPSDILDLSLPEKTASYQEYAEKYSKQFAVQINSDNMVAQNGVRKLYRYRDTKTDSFVLSEEQTRILCGRANEPYAIKTEELLMATVCITLVRLLGCAKIVVDMERHGRNCVKEVNVNRTIGWFTEINSVVLDIKSTEIYKQLAEIRDQLRIGLRKEDKRFCIGGDIRFNYLGEFKEYKNEVLTLKNNSIDENVGSENQFDYMVDLNAFLWKSRMYIHVRYTSEVNKFISNMHDVLQEIIKVCEGMRNNRIYTPGDFDLVDLTQEELNLLLK